MTGMISSEILICDNDLADCQYNLVWGNGCIQHIILVGDSSVEPEWTMKNREVTSFEVSAQEVSEVEPRGSTFRGSLEYMQQPKGYEQKGKIAQSAG